MNRNPSNALETRALDDEDRQDLKDGRAALSEFQESGEPAAALDELKRRLGLR